MSILDWGKYFPEKSAADLEKFLASLAQSGIVPLSGLEGVWFMTGMFGRKRATIHVIQTVRGSAFTST